MSGTKESENGKEKKTLKTCPIVQTLAKTFSRYHCALLYAFVWDRGAINSFARPGAVYLFLILKLFKNFFPRGMS